MNNPVNDKDVNGRFGFLIALLIGAVIGAVVGAVSYSASVVVKAIFTGEWSWSWGDFLGSILGGAIGGMVAAIPIPGVSFYLGAFVSGFSTTMISDALNANFSGNEYDYDIRSSALNAAWSGIISIITAGVMKGMGANFSKLYGRGSYNQVSEQIYTKLFRNQISGMSTKTLGKMTLLELYLSILSPFTVLFEEN